MNSSAVTPKMDLVIAKQYELSLQFIQVKPMPQISKGLPSNEAKRLAREALMEKSFYRLRKTKVNPFPYDFILKPKNLCDNHAFIVILIHSYHDHEERRQAIRETWGSIAKGSLWPQRNIDVSVRMAYVFGRHLNDSLNNVLRDEAKVNNDIIQGNFMESYTNLTLKSILGLRFFSQYCGEARYYLKADDDVFVNLPFWVEILQHTPMHRSVMGAFHHQEIDKSKTRRVSRKDYPFERYTPYEMGLGYVIDGGLVHELISASEYVPSIPVEDVYVTGILGRILNVTHVVLKGAPFWHYFPPKSCEISANLTLVAHKVDPENMHRIWSDLINNVAPCPEMNADICL